MRGRIPAWSFFVGLARLGSYENTMPTRMKTPCSYPGCATPARGRYCDQHALAANRTNLPQRASAAARGYDHAWRKLRAWYVTCQPLCEDCLEQDHLTLVDEVDHIIPIHVRPDLRLDPDNLRSLCRRHHRLKSAQDIQIYGSASAAREARC